MAKKKSTSKKAVVRDAGAAGRAKRYSPDAKIRMLVDENPCRPGTDAASYWSQLEDGESVGEAKAKGVPTTHLRYWEKHGQLQIAA